MAPGASGVENLNTTLDEYSRQLANCTFCPKLCRFSCPVAQAEHSETVTPWFKMSLAQMVHQGGVDLDAGVGEVFLHCLGCLHCMEYCKHENNVPEVLMAARAVAHESKVKVPGVQQVLEKMYDLGNPWGEKLEEILYQAVDPKFIVPEAQVVIFAGCQALRKPERHLEPVLSLLDLLGVDYVGLHGGDRQCCGAPLWYAGDRPGFDNNASALRASFTNTKKVICLCPTCAYVLKGGLGAEVLGESVQVVTLDEFLMPLIRKSPPRRKLNSSLTFHDPCYLTRYLDRGSEVRELIGMVLDNDLMESNWSGKDAVCCGGGGGVAYLLPEVAKAAASDRMIQLETTGAQRVLTACPNCLRQLEHTEKMDLVDLAELILEAYSCEE